MPEILRPTPRPSKTENLESLYKSISTNNIGAAPSFGGGIRSNLLPEKVTANTRAWGEATRAGAPSYISTNRYQDTRYQRTFQPSQFLVNSPMRVTSFNGYSLGYAQNAYDHDNRNYR